MKEEYRKILLEMSRNQYGKALNEFLKEEKEKIGNIKLSISWEDTRGRQIALDIIDKLFSFMENKEIKNKEKNQYV